jgi:hypothetical protein
MEILRNVLVVLHFVGFASILGGVLVQTSAFKSGAKVVPAILHGAYTQLITGIALVGIIEATTDAHVNNIKISVKLAVLIVITVLAFINRKKDKPATWVVPVIGVLTLVNVVLAVFWK